MLALNYFGFRFESIWQHFILQLLRCRLCLRLWLAYFCNTYICGLKRFSGVRQPKTVIERSLRAARSDRSLVGRALCLVRNNCLWLGSRLPEFTISRIEVALLGRRRGWRLLLWFRRCCRNGDYWLSRTNRWLLLVINLLLGQLLIGTHVCLKVILRQLLLLLVKEEVLVLRRVHWRSLVMAHHLLLRLLA